MSKDIESFAATGWDCMTRAKVGDHVGIYAYGNFGVSFEIAQITGINKQSITVNSKNHPRFALSGKEWGASDWRQSSWAVRYRAALIFDLGSAQKFESDIRAKAELLVRQDRIYFHLTNKKRLHELNEDQVGVLESILFPTAQPKGTTN